MGRSSSFADEGGAARRRDPDGRAADTLGALGVHGPFGDDAHPFAHRLTAVVAPHVSVLLAVDPVARRAELVTGASVRRHLDGVAVAASLAGATPQWSPGNVAAGISQCLSRLMGASDRERIQGQSGLPPAA
jgi:hypothetical protein